MAGLRQALLKRPELFVSTVTEKLLTYALGLDLEHSDGREHAEVHTKGEMGVPRTLADSQLADAIPQRKYGVAGGRRVQRIGGRVQGRNHQSRVIASD